ncbi:MAG: DUF4864 domain-containing protein [Litorivicinus sp.]
MSALTRLIILAAALFLPQAHAEESPRAVLERLLYALQTNNEANDGIALVFDYASPSNKAMTGPLPRFIDMVSRHPYAELLQHQSAAIGPAVDRDNQRQFPIRLITEGGTAMGYLWTLEQQPNDRWMTTMVRPVALGPSMKGL